MAARNIQLSDDEVDDILYLTRTNDTAELLPYLSQLSQQKGTESPVSILEACADEDSGNTAIHYAAANGSTDLLKDLLNLFSTSSSSAAPATKKHLLNQKNAAGNTALHWAALNGHASTVQLLTENGADCWVKNTAGNLPVFEAERAGKDEVVAVLLLAGGKEVDDELRRKEGSVSKEEEDEVDDDAGVGSSRSADEAAEKLEKMEVREG